MKVKESGGKMRIGQGKGVEKIKTKRLKKRIEEGKKAKQREFQKGGKRGTRKRWHDIIW